MSIGAGFHQHQRGEVRTCYNLYTHASHQFTQHTSHSNSGLSKSPFDDSSQVHVTCLISHLSLIHACSVSPDSLKQYVDWNEQYGSFHPNQPAAE